MGYRRFQRKKFCRFCADKVVDLSQAIVGTYQFSIRISNEIEVIALKKVSEPEAPGSILTIKEEDKD